MTKNQMLALKPGDRFEFNTGGLVGMVFIVQKHHRTHPWAYYGKYQDMPGITMTDANAGIDAAPWWHGYHNHHDIDLI